MNGLNNTNKRNYGAPALKLVVVLCGESHPVINGIKSRGLTRFLLEESLSGMILK